MSTATKTAKMSAMEPDPTLLARGLSLKEWASARRGRIAQLMTASGIKSNDTVYAAFRGESSIDSLERLEAARREIEDHPTDANVPVGAFAARTEDGEIIEFEVSADAVGLRVFVRGPIGRGDDLSAHAARVFREIQKATATPGETTDLGNQD